MNMLRHLQRMNIKPLVVFDGSNLPAKRGEETRRREYATIYQWSLTVLITFRTRNEHFKLAMELVRQNNIIEANKEFQLAVDVNPLMAYNWIQVHVLLVCSKSIHFIVYTDFKTRRDRLPGSTIRSRRPTGLPLHQWPRRSGAHRGLRPHCLRSYKGT